jgi:hypothetical protein
MKIAGVIIPSGGSPTVLANQTLSQGSWTLSGSYYQYTFSNAAITGTSVVSFVPNNDSVTTVSTCLLLPEITPSAGSCILYSQFPPANNILGTFIIQ